MVGRGPFAAFLADNLLMCVGLVEVIDIHKLSVNTLAKLCIGLIHLHFDTHQASADCQRLLVCTESCLIYVTN